MVNAWIEAEWLLPVTARTGFDFSEADLARALLIQELKADFGVNDEGIAVALHLLDQLHGLRSLLKDIRAADASTFDRDDG
jgi:chaperone modulatory protein CbpM